MLNFFKSAKFKIIAAVLTALIAGMVFAAVSSGSTSPLTNAAGFVFAPLENAGVYIASKVSGFALSFASSKYYQKEIEKLELQLEEYREKLVGYEEVKKKIELYEGFLGLKENNPDFDFIEATIIGRDPADVFRSFVINKGTANGIKINSPIISGKYLVGVVRKVNLTSSVVYAVGDPKVKIGAYEIKSREDGYIEGTAEFAFSGECRFTELPKDTAVAEGGIICTSGIAGVYPRDLIIGTVTEVRDGDTGLSSYAVVKPGIDYASLTDVFVITSFLGQNE
ncbi:MAG: rod shape-determining protein MreC [Oscillospiraceae bacterium]|nr:rod shape-determining protein MreC [Oscillospiraceae bacterium]